MSAVRSSTDVWVVRDPPLTCDCVSRACMVEARLLAGTVGNLDYDPANARHPTIWLSEAEAMRDFRARARLWKALRRRWAANRRATLP